jgi:hypothetical protein
MSYDYETTCPHCRLNHTIPYEDVRHHIFHILGQESAKKRKDFPEHMRKMHQANRLKNGGRPTLYSRQEAILALAKREDIEKLKLREIAEKVGIEGKHRVAYVCKIITMLRQKGLLDVKRRMPAFHVQPL